MIGPFLKSRHSATRNLTAAALLLAPFSAAAEPKQPPAEQSVLSVQVGGAKATLRVMETSGGRKLFAGSTAVVKDAVLPAGPVTAQTVPLPDGKEALLVYIGEGPETFTGVLLGKGNNLRHLWGGSGGGHGDPGERRADRLDTLQTESGATVLVSGQTYERTRMCGSKVLPLLARQAITSEGLVPYSAERPGLGETVAATVSASAASESPVLLLLSARGASEAHGEPAIDPPYAVVDGQIESARALPFPGSFVTLGYGGGPFGIARMELVFSGTPPKRLRLQVDDSYLDVQVPPSLPAGERLVVTPASPLHTGCLTVQVIEPGEAGGGLSEVVAFSTLEARGGGIAALLDALSGPEGSEAARIVQNSGRTVVPALVASWGSLAQAAKQRTLSLVGRHLEIAGATDIMSAALASDDPERAAMAATTLLASKDPKALELVAIRIEGPKPDGLLAELAARSGRTEMLLPILSGLRNAEDSASQAMLQRAFGTLARRITDEAQLASAIRDFATRSPTTVSNARVARELASAGRLPAIASELANAARLALESEGPSPVFESRWWVVKALGATASEVDGDSYLARAAITEEAWMLRDAALQALAERASDGTTQVAQTALKDANPRVRSRAVRILAKEPGQLAALLPHLTRDRWHLVRIAAAESLPDSPEVRAGLIRIIDDRVAPVQAAAIKRATELALAEAFPAIAPLLEDGGKSDQVRFEAMRFVSQLCQRSAAPSLVSIAEKGLAPGASESAQELAISALEALAVLGAQEEVTAIVQTVVDPGLRAAADQALKTESTCRRVGTQLQL